MNHASIKKGRGRALRLLFASILVCAATSSAQDKFLATRLTFEPAQQGFATWSPDGQSLVYQYTDMRDTLGKNGLWRVALDGAVPQQIFRGVAEHARWSPAGKFIVFDADTGNSIKMIPDTGGEARRFLPDSIVIKNGGLPCWSPDGSSIAFLERTGMSVCIYNMKTGVLKSIFREEGKVPLPGGWWNDGKSVLIALMERQTRKSIILRVSADGTMKQQLPCPHETFYRHLALSPDGSMLIYAALAGRYLGLHVMPAEGGKSIPLAVTEQNHNEGPIWSPDGKRIAFTSTRSGNFDIWTMDIDAEQLRKELRALNTHD